MTCRLRTRLRSLRGSGIVAIATGSAVGQGIAILAAPILSRLYTPADFGVFVVVSSIGLAVGTVASLRYEMAIPLPEQDADARDLVLLSTLSALITCGVLGLVAWLLRGAIVPLVGGGLTAIGLVLAFGIAVLVAFYRLLSQWTLRRQQYALTARRNVLQSVLTVVVQLGAGLASWAPGLSVGLASGQAAGALSLLKGSRLRRFPGPRRLRHNAARFRRFPLLLAPAGVLNVAGLYVPLILLASLYGPHVAGFVGLTQRVLGLPMTLLGQSVAQVFLSELAQRKRDSLVDGDRIFWRATKRLLLVASVIACMLLAAGPFLFEVVFGAQWRTAGVMSQALGLALAGQLVASSLSHTLIVYERTRAQFLWDAFRFVATAGSVVTASALGLGPVACVWLFSLATLGSYIILWEMSRRTLRNVLGLPIPVVDPVQDN